MGRSLLWLIFLAGLVHAGQSQHLHHAIRNYTAIDGLPQSQVTAIVEDKNGYLWVGTQGGGVARFDGREFKVYTTMDGLFTNFAADLLIDKDQNLWILHHWGMTKYDGLNFTQFRAPEASRSYGSFRKLFEANDTIYAVSTSGRLGKFHGDSAYYWSRPLVEDREVLRFHKGPDNMYCLLLEDGEFLMIRNNERFTIPFATQGKYFNMFDHGDEVWVHADRSVYRLDADAHELVELPFHIPYYVLHYDADGDVFWTRDMSNLYRTSVKGNVVKSDTVLSDVETYKVLTDSENNIWFTSDGRGLFKYYFKDFDKYNSDDLRGVMAIHRDHKGTKWIGTMSKGLWKIERGKLTSYLRDEHTDRYTIVSIKEDAGHTLWVASKYGLGKYLREQDTFKWYTMKDGLSHNSVINVATDEKGGVWAGTYGGLDYFDGTSFTHYGEEKGLSGNNILATLYMQSLKTLFVSNDAGVSAIDSDGKVTHIPVPELENTMVLSLNPYRDSLLLVGSGGSGILIYNPKSREKRFITTRDGLTSDFIYFVAEDPDHRIWVGMEKGITRLKLNDELEIVENLHYDYDNGLTGVETNQNAFFLEGEQKYFGLIDGLYEFNDLMNKGGEKSFDLHLTDVEILYGEYSARDYAEELTGFFRIPKDPVLPPDRNHITFHFNRVDKRYPKSVKFKYLLQNFDKTWSQPSSMTQVTYGNLPPGYYCFRVMATNSEGNWSENRVAYTFTVRAPFYQTPSFIAGIIIFMAGSITLLMYLRVRQRVKKMIDTERIRMQELESLRKEIARDFHDEMGNQLTRIINYISLMKLNGNGTNGSHAHLYSKVEESAKFLYTGTRDFIWSIDPVNDELSQLFIHIRDFGEKLFEEKSISFRAYNEVKEKIKLPGGFSREANLIFKEAMTNAFKYAEAENVKLALKREADHFEIIFEDDGIGFTVQKENSNGLKNIRERAEKINAVLRIVSLENKGTIVALNFKLTKTMKHGPAF